MFSGSFSSSAEIVLRTSAQGVLDRFLSEPGEGRWHPNGFAVFDLGDVEGLGQMRFHVWPSGIRVALEGQPAIHSHPWDMCSLVIAGCYRDTLYRARQFNVDEPGRLQGYSVQFGSGDQGDQLCLDSMWYDVTAEQERTVTKGSLHQIPAGVLHAAQIPLHTCVATLLITSKFINLSKLLLLGDGNFDKKSYVRPAVSVEELDHLRADLMNVLMIL